MACFRGHSPTWWCSGNVEKVCDMKQCMKPLVGAGAVAMMWISGSVAAAQEVQLGDCGSGQATVHVSGMGMVTAEHLQQHIERMKEDLDKARRTEAASSAHRKALEQHMQDMETGMAQMETALTKQNCPPNSVPLATRVEDLERRVNTLQQMLDQVIGHQREAERSGR